MTEQFLFEREGDPITFSNIEGQAVTISLGNKRILSSTGTFGTIYEVAAMVGKHKGSSKPIIRHFVLKQFKHNEVSTAKECVEMALENYANARERVLKYFLHIGSVRMEKVFS